MSELARTDPRIRTVVADATEPDSPALLLSADSPRVVVLVAGAPPVLVAGPAVGEVQRCKQGGTVLGVCPGAEFETGQVELEVGSQLALFGRPQRPATGTPERPQTGPLADALLAHGYTVLHLMSGGRQEEHRLHPAARIECERVVYDRPEPEQQALLG